ncbi:MAG: RluA family pseudouridine synthase [Actinomycetota bacterium]|nr:RluA family pseudouridine synthase [Actinomycetota bacterium]
MIEEEIPAALAGERLDRIVSLITDCSRSDAAVLVAAGGASIDGEVHMVGKLRVREGQIVAVDPALLPVTAPPAADPSVVFTVVHVDEHLIVIDKPAGLVVHPGAGHLDGTLVNGLLARFPEIATVGEPHRPGIVHRLDVGTSGLLAVAHTQRAYHSLVDALAARDVGRVYRTLVWGHLANPVGVVDAPIGRDHRDAMRMAVVVDGKPARTRYRVLREYRTPTEASALECRLETGRTHQIRVHLAAIGHPVVGDGAYGGVRTGITPPRPFLHAAALELVHPVTGEALEFSSPLPDDLAAVEAALGT